MNFISNSKSFGLYPDDIKEISNTFLQVRDVSKFVF